MSARPGGVWSLPPNLVLSGLRGRSPGHLSPPAPAADVVEVATDLGGPLECTIIGGPRKVSVLNAVLANGALVRVLDLNDIMFTLSEGHLAVGGHRSDNIPVGLAMGEKLGSPLIDVLEAIIIGYELYGRLRDLTRAPQPFDGTSVSGFVAAAM